MLPTLRRACLIRMSSPIVHHIYEKITGTCQFIAYCPETMDAVIIDPVLDYQPESGKITTVNADSLLLKVTELKCNVKRILETHCHADHLTASAYLKRKLNQVPLICIGEGIIKVQKTFASKINTSSDHIKTDGSQFDHLFKDQEIWTLGNIECRVINTPGHTPDSVAYLIGDKLFAGDSIFMPDLGTARCDFPNGSALELFASIQKIYALPDTTQIYVGHDYPPTGREACANTSVLEEKTMNKHVKVGSTVESLTEWRTTRDAELGTPRLLYPALHCNLRAGQLPSSHFFTIPIFVPENF